MNKLTCNKCGVSKEATRDNFYWRKDTSNWNKICKKCKAKTSADWAKNNPEKYRAWKKAWDKKYNKEYYANNRDKELERTRNKPKHLVNKYNRKRKSKPTQRLRGTISRSISIRLKKTGSSKAGISHLDFVDWTYEELKKHLESQFEPWMTWDNYGRYDLNTWDDSNPSTWTWQIDHIISHSNFSYTSMSDTEFKKCWALSNLRPYSAKQNILDGAREKEDGRYDKNG